MLGTKCGKVLGVKAAIGALGGDSDDKVGGCYLGWFLVGMLRSPILGPIAGISISQYRSQIRSSGRGLNGRFKHHFKSSI